MNEKRNEDENDKEEEGEEEDEGERGENKAQVKEFKKSRTQKINEKIVDLKRVFIILKSSIL